MSKLVPYWREWWRLHSVRAAGVGALLSIVALSTVKVSAAAALVAVLDYRIVIAILLVLDLCVIAGALIDQPKLKDPKDPE